MNTFEKSLRIFADFIFGIIGQTTVDYTNGRAPLWSVIGVAILGLITIVIVVVGAIAYFT